MVGALQSTGGSLTAAIENQPLRWDIELVQQGTERIPVDAEYVASRVGDFK
jgi:hypothetical protein